MRDTRRRNKKPLSISIRAKKLMLRTQRRPVRAAESITPTPSNSGSNQTLSRSPCNELAVAIGAPSTFNQPSSLTSLSVAEQTRRSLTASHRTWHRHRGDELVHDAAGHVEEVVLRHAAEVGLLLPSNEPARDSQRGDGERIETRDQIKNYTRVEVHIKSKPHARPKPTQKGRQQYTDLYLPPDPPPPELMRKNLTGRVVSQRQRDGKL